MNFMVRIVNGQIVQDGDSADSDSGASPNSSAFGSGSSNMLDAIMNGSVTLCGGRVFSLPSIIGMLLVTLFLFGFQGFMFLGIGLGIAYYMEQRNSDGGGGSGSLFGSSSSPSVSNSAGYSRVATLGNPTGGSSAPAARSNNNGGTGRGSNIKGIGDLPKPPAKC